MEQFSLEPGPEEIEMTDSLIEKRVKELFTEYSDMELSPDLEDVWADVVNEAEAGIDRLQALQRLRSFMADLERLRGSA